MRKENSGAVSTDYFWDLKLLLCEILIPNKFKFVLYISLQKIF